MNAQPEADKDYCDLGLAILNCMDGPGREVVRTGEGVRVERRRFKTFGLLDEAPWIGCKDLMEFLDLLFGSRLPKPKNVRAVAF